MNPPPTPPAGPTGPGHPGGEDPAARIARLTALALGELPPAEAAAVEAGIWRDQEARAEVDGIRRLAEHLTFAYAAEAPATLTPAQHRAILDRRPRLSGNEDKDARLTAYALGELRPSQAEMLSAHLSADRAATAELEAVGALASRLRAAFAEEELPLLTLVQRQRVLDHGYTWTEKPEAVPTPEPTRTAVATGRPPRRLRTAALAAGFAALGYLASSREPSPAPLAAVPAADPPPARTAAPPRDDGFFPPLPPVATPQSPHLAALLDREKQRPAAGRPSGSRPASPPPAASPAVVATTDRPEVPVATTAAAETVPNPRFQPDASILPPPRRALAAATARTVPDGRTLLQLAQAAPGAAPLSGFLSTSEAATASLPADLGRAGYDVVRQCLRDFGTLPPASLVRPEEIINQFDYDLQPPPGQDFAVAIEAADCPWNEAHELVKVTVASRADAASHPPLRLTVFLRLAESAESERAQLLAWQGLQALAARLRPQDSVSLVVWGRARGVVLPPTGVDGVESLREAPTRWHQGGTVLGADDWATAEQALLLHAADNARNVCLVLTDGPLDFSGLTLAEAARNLRTMGAELAVAELGPLRPASGTAHTADLATTPFFRADSGPEAARLLAREIFLSPAAVGEDVRIDVAFNPAALAAWRPIGFGAIGRPQRDAAGRLPVWASGRQLTALYEVVPAAAVPGTALAVGVFASPVRPGAPQLPAPEAAPPLSVRLQYRVPRSSTTHTLQTDWTSTAAAWRTASPDFRLAAGAAAFALRLQNDPALDGLAVERITRWVRTAADSRDPYGLRREFAGMIEAVAGLENESSH